MLSRSPYELILEWRILVYTFARPVNIMFEMEAAPCSAHHIRLQRRSRNVQERLLVPDAKPVSVLRILHGHGHATISESPLCIASRPFRHASGKDRALKASYRSCERTSNIKTVLVTRYRREQALLFALSIRGWDCFLDHSAAGYGY
jgi:hypothetical protein